MANFDINSVSPLVSTTRGLAISCFDHACYMHYPSQSSSFNYPRILCVELKLGISYNLFYCYFISHKNYIYYEDISDSGQLAGEMQHKYPLVRIVIWTQDT
jgi:hypothetical protein